MSRSANLSQKPPPEALSKKETQLHPIPVQLGETLSVPSVVSYNRLSQINNLVQQIINVGDNSRTSLKTTLNRNQFNEVPGNVSSRQLQCT